MGHRSPLLPIFAAIDTLQSNFQYTDLDIITDRNNLRKLLRCIDNQSEKAFRIDVDLLGKTCLLTRREEFMMETVNEFRGYGHEYEQAATKPRRGSEDELGHHRIVSYVSHQYRRSGLHSNMFYRRLGGSKSYFDVLLTPIWNLAAKMMIFSLHSPL